MKAYSSGMTPLNLAPPKPTLDDQSRNTTAVPTSTAAPGVFNCFLSTFVTIFLAELGDKTQVATLLMSAQSHQPWVVFAGAASALIATSLVGVLIGRWLTKRLTPRTLELATGGILAVVATLLFIDIAGM
ncbi:TMEM165/GDT1 family protein [Alkalinema sp. FACHB-956]|uniref:TMEM165/GDT1 family protein n=1 Tax=Alkalinema sp. FACHB-956 TaxID=2692768 RepID=UPI0018F051A9|nr:TMEM165/GDT1 family protein [Alkalinema sp. FACHB-956]